MISTYLHLVSQSSPYKARLILEDKVSYHKLNRVVPVIAAVPDTVSLLEQITMVSSTWHAATDLANVFVSSSSRRRTRSSLHSRGINNMYTHNLGHGYVNSSINGCHNIV